MDRASEVIRSRNNPLLRRLRSLVRRAGELALLEGVKLVEEAAEAGIDVLEIAASPRAVATPRVRGVIETLRARGSPLRLVDEGVLASLSEVETSQGILAIARRPSFDEERIFGAVPLVLVAAGIQDPGNLGGLLRTAEAAGATGAYLAEGCADPFSWKALRGSMGSAFRLPHVSGVALDALIPRLKTRVALVATAREGTPYESVDLRGPVALLLGSEGHGLPAPVLRQADAVAAIPMRGRAESLNVGVAAGILLFEAARQRRKAG